jgi:orotate phosphoribosyltransferase
MLGSPKSRRLFGERRNKMKDKAYKVALEKNPIISMEVIPGHFTTSGTHTTHFLDVSELKSNSVVARDIARELAVP